MSTSNGPYANTTISSGNTGLLETTLTASLKTGIDALNIGGGVTANVEVFNGEIPGPTFDLKVGDTVVVRLINNLPYEMGIHWHGIELENYSDGTEVTQNGAAPAVVQTLGNGVQAGGTFLYKFKVTRPGIFWYHPHHGNSINRVFRGLYGMIIVTDPPEAGIVGSVLPAAADTMQLVLSDITVCKTPGSNDAQLFDFSALPVADRPEWLSGTTTKPAPTPRDLCEIAPTGSARDDDGALMAVSYGNHDVPSIMRPQRMIEGQTVLTNGVNVEHRFGTPASPRAFPVAPVPRSVRSGQNLRLQIVNCAHLRYFRLLLTTEAGANVNLMRIGGEAGLLDAATLEGGNIGTVNTQYSSGEIVLPPGTRADVVASIPGGLPMNSRLTLWTRDYQWTGNGFAILPTVPVAHFEVTGTEPPHALTAGTLLRSAAGMPPVDDLTAVAAVNPLNPAPKIGNASKDIQLKPVGGTGPNFDSAPGKDLMMDPITMHSYARYTDAPHITSSRFAEAGQVLELTLTNTTASHHPFHLHGFSFQPIDMRPTGGAANAWPRHEFRDTIDLFPGHTLTMRVPLIDRNLADNATPGGMFGRWLFHCHLFFHHARGMVSELVVTDNAKGEKPNVNVGGSWEYKPVGWIATRKGTFFHRDGLAITLTASIGTVTPGPGGTWSWSYTTLAADPQYQYVYITATDTNSKKDMAVFKLQTGGPSNTAWDVGDPHILTTDGTRYDFQAAGEFILLRDREGMEIQVRQTPALTAQPIADDYTGLTECVSLNTAVAARVGPYRISYQPGRDDERLMLFVNGEPAELPKTGLDVGEHRVSTFEAGGQTGLRVDYAHGPVLMVTPQFWSTYGLWYLDINITNTNADEGLMGSIANGSWLPALPDGSTVGPKPASAHDRYVALYRTFADAWRLTDVTTLFVYFQGKSTKSYTDRDWPSEKLPCSLKQGFPKPTTPILENIPIEKARRICKGVTEKDLHANCVFDVVTTGDETLAKGYLVAQDLRRRSTAVQIVGDKPQTRLREPLTVTAIVLPISSGGSTPTGSVTFVIDGAPMKEATKLDKHGRAKMILAHLKVGAHQIRADYTPGGQDNHYYSSSSPNLLHAVTKGRGSTGGRDSDDDDRDRKKKDRGHKKDRDRKKKDRGHKKDRDRKKKK